MLMWCSICFKFQFDLIDFMNAVFADLDTTISPDEPAILYNPEFMIHVSGLIERTEIRWEK